MLDSQIFIGHCIDIIDRSLHLKPLKINIIQIWQVAGEYETIKIICKKKKKYFFFFSRLDQSSSDVSSIIS